MILVGEMRDLETISTALTAAETGHLVFATLHTQSTAQTVDRIIDVFPPEQQGQVRTQLSIALQGIVTQQLLPTARRHGPGRRQRGAGPDAGDPQPDPRGQDAPDLRRPADLRRGRDADDGRRPGAPRAAGKITRSLAEQRASVPEELNRLLGGAAGRRDGGRDRQADGAPAAASMRTAGGAADGRAQPPSRSARWTSPGPPPAASSRPSPRPRSPSSCASAA